MQFIVGIGIGAFIAIVMTSVGIWIANDEARSLCKHQQWAGAACQCRLTLGDDKKQ